jgi:hypothetical protein
VVLLLPQQVRSQALAAALLSSASAAVGIDDADDAEFWQHIGSGAGVYMQRMHSNVSSAEQQLQPVWLQQANSWSCQDSQSTVQTLHCRVCASHA